ncbi:DUF4381 domain-containing protein [Marinicella rhabdoformis]|uniref:DUF4381 domain-containing protein n=1 Tax=Marinicella rhabdoformis TaxID=2580566 RepID=UPI001C55274C|nr:DUF4381 domain-containing protein [Marinicella rhabdoformis]
MQQTVPMNSNPPNMTQAAQELPLRDLHLPAEPGFWPLAPGWWFVLTLLVLFLFFLGVKWYKRRQRIKRFNEIEQQLGAINFAYTEHKDKRLLLSELSMLLRRFEKFQQHNDHQVTLAGAQWIEHLNSYHKEQPFTQFQGLLTDAIYQPTVEFDEKALSELIHNHIKKVVMKQLIPQRNEAKEVSNV